jgi:3'-phosphoadenosine 5'-phosphosulfate sulfotransferase (PAPS reductase)/FAD synthetase
MAKLTVISDGMGQDSAAIKNLYRFESKFRKQYAPEDLLVICSDTGDEHDETYEYVEETKRYCKEDGIEFIHLTPDMGYHGTGWSTLCEQYDTRKNVGSKAFHKSCTHRLKLGPIYSYLSDYVKNKYPDLPEVSKTYRNKAPLVAFAEKYGKIDMLIGIAAGEERRVNKVDKEKLPKWQRESINVRYPLVDWGMDRKKCQDYVSALGQVVPIPSCCQRCPFMDERELLLLYHTKREVFDDWVRQEQVKLEHFKHKGDKNVGVWGKPNYPLTDVLKDAQKKYGHMTIEQLREHRFSHGHCVASSY